MAWKHSGRYCQAVYIKHGYMHNLLSTNTSSANDRKVTRLFEKGNITRTNKNGQEYSLLLKTVLICLVLTTSNISHGREATDSFSHMYETSLIRRWLRIRIKIYWCWPSHKSFSKVNTEKNVNTIWQYSVSSLYVLSHSPSL